jgi:SRSO17 transposase
MDLDSKYETAHRLAAYLGEVAKVCGHADRVGPMMCYCAGLLVTEGRRNAEVMAAATKPAADMHVSMQHQKLQHVVANSMWSDRQVLAKVQELVVPVMTQRGPIEVWIIDDTSFPKQGKHSVGVQRQYCGQLGKQANCQVTVTLSIANHHASLPIAYQLYLPREWADDRARRKKAHVPDAIRFKTKPQIALEQIRAALDAGVPPGVVLMDAGYGNNSILRQAITGLGLPYVVSIQTTTKVRPVREDDPKSPVCACAFRRPAANRVSPKRRCSSNGPRTRPSRRNTGSQPSLRRCRSAGSSIWPTCAGASSTITVISSRKSASATMRAAAGRASIITAHCPSQPTAS